MIRFFGEDITALPPHERIRKGLRRTYQSSLLFRELTVRDNLFLAVRGVANGRFSFCAGPAAIAPVHAATKTCSSARAWPTSPTNWWPTWRTASSASWRSAWRWPARRG